MKFSFKTKKPTGKFASFESTTCDIYLDGSLIGEIRETERYSDEWAICLMISDEIGWSWKQLKQKFDTIANAKQYILENTEKITKLNLHKQ